MERLAPDRFATVPRNPEWLNSIAALAQTSVLPARRAARRDALRAARPVSRPHHRLRHGHALLRLGRAFSRHPRHPARTLRRAPRPASTRPSRRRSVSAAPCLVRLHALRAGRALALARRAAGEPRRGRGARRARRGRYAEAHGMRRLQRVLDALRYRLAIDRGRRARRRPRARAALFRKEGDYWRLGWDAREFRLRDRVGLHYLATLIANPGTRVPRRRSGALSERTRRRRRAAREPRCSIDGAGLPRAARQRRGHARPPRRARLSRTPRELRTCSTRRAATTTSGGSPSAERRNRRPHPRDRAQPRLAEPRARQPLADRAGAGQRHPCHPGGDAPDPGQRSAPTAATSPSRSRPGPSAPTSPIPS